MPDFIPRKDSHAATWALTFMQALSADTTRHNLSADALSELTDRCTDFVAAVRTTSDPLTRTTPAITHKNAARLAFERVARQAAGRVRADPAVDRTTLVALGLAVGPGRSAPRRRVGRPKSMPQINVLGVDGVRVTLRLSHADAPTSNAMHTDVANAQVYAFAGEQYPADMAAWRYMGSFSRATCDVAFDPSLPTGTRVWINARWCNRRGEVGRFGRPAMAVLNDSGVVARAA